MAHHANSSRAGMTTAAVLLTALHSTSASTLQLQLLPASTYPLAVCNDGTQSGYYIKTGVDASSWIVHMQGGDWCYSPETCAARAKASPNLVSSKGWPETKTVGGIFGSNDTRLSSSNQIYLMYCSSDGYAGNSDNKNAAGFYFRGKEIVRAVIADLAQRHGLGSLNYAEFIFSGCSAGARGALFNAAAVAKQLLPLNVGRFGVLLDSAYWQDVLPSPAKESFAQQAAAVYSLTNASGTIDPACAAVYSGANGWKCLFGQYAVPTLKQPFLLHQYQYDLFQLGYDLSASPPTTPAQLAYAEMFRNSTRSNAAFVPSAGTTLLLPACYKHCNTEDSLFWTLATNGITLQTMTLSWFYGDGTAPDSVVDNCVGFNCGPGCPKP